METLQDLVARLRRFRSEHQISPKTPIAVTVHDPDAVAEDWWAEHLATLTGCTIRYGAPLEGSAVSRVIAGPVQAFIPLEGLVDVDAERERLERALADGEADLERSRSKLANPNFRDRAPAEVVAGEEAKVAAGEERSEKLRAQLEELG
jgi:valyl-tRNA synthetase